MPDNDTYLLKIGELIGQVGSLTLQISSMHQTLAELRSSMHTELVEHEEREVSRISSLEKRVETQQRVVWIAYGGLFMFGLVFTVISNLPILFPVK